MVSITGRIAGLIVLGMTAGCASSGTSQAAPRMDWRAIATEPDRARLRDWRSAWVQAIDKAKASGHGAEIAAEGALLHPDAALAGATPPVGDYRCRVIKLGAKAKGALDYVSYPSFTCRIAEEGGMLSFTKLDGSQRPCGFLFPGDGSRMIFLGTMLLSDERKPLDYGRDRERDMAGAFERIGDRRWRLALPYPHWESTLDVVEITPIG